MGPSKLPKVSLPLCSPPDWRPRSYQSLRTNRVHHPTSSLGVTKVSLFIAIPILPSWLFAPSELPECQCLSCLPCPGGDLSSRSYQDVAIHRVALPCPRGDVCLRSYHSLAIYRVPSLAQVMTCAFGVAKVSLVLVLLPLPRW